MRLVYANCFVGEVDDDVLATDERLVADAAPAGVRTLMADEQIDPEQAQQANIALWGLAYTWFRLNGEDPSFVEDVSAADLAGAEIAISLLLPAARGALSLQRLIQESPVSELRTAVPERGSEAFRRAELAQCAGAEAAVRARFGEGAIGKRIGSTDPRNELIESKFAHVRDPWLVSRGASRRFALGAAELMTRLRRGLRPSSGGTVLVYEYNPTRVFASRYSKRPLRRGLVRVGAGRESFLSALGAGDVVAAMPPPPSRATAPAARARLEAFTAAHEEELGAAFTVAGAPLWEAVREPILDVIEGYCAYAAAAAPRVRRLLERSGVEAVLVPFDSPPEARLLVRVAQGMGIATYVLNNGIMCDDFTPECMTADVGLAWSDQLAREFFARRGDRATIVTGNPKADMPHGRPARTRSGDSRTILVGSFTFSPVDLNCRRSDSERYAEEVLRGVEAAVDGGARVILKLHPADAAGYYARLLEDSRRASVEVVAEGDVTGYFGVADVYVSTYSTSILESAAAGLPVVYYAVNAQRFHPPFEADPFLERWTARSPDELMSLLRAMPEEAPSVEELSAWAEVYLGPLDGRSVDRIAQALEGGPPAELMAGQPSASSA